jgi:hypothetical protein
MTTTTTGVWQPFHDEPLFVPELLHGPDAVPDALHTRIVDYLTQVAAIRRAPLHTCTAFNALHFGFGLQTRGYRAEILDPELFVQVSTEQQDRPVLAVGTFVHIDRGGRRSLLAEVVARYGADPAVDDDGWTPAALSGAPPGHPDGDGSRTGQERIVLDVEAFGAPLTPAEYTELHRLRRRGTLLDRRGHLTRRVRYPAEPGTRDDVALYAAYLLGPARPLLLGGPLGGLLTDPDNEQVLAAALQQAMATIDALLGGGTLRRWYGYATCRSRFEQRRQDGWPGLPATDIDDIVHTLVRTGTQPRYTGIWPLLAARADSRAGADEDPLELAGAADLVLHTNLVAADLTANASDGILPGGIHLRIDDTWQAGGLWRAQREPVPAAVLAADPRTALGLGHQAGMPAQPPSAKDQPHDTKSEEPEPAAGPDQPPGDDEPFSPDTSTVSELAMVRDSLVVYTIALRESHWEAGELPLAEPAAAVLAPGPLILELHHDGEVLDDVEQIQPVVRDGAVLRDIAWPWSFYPGIKVTVAVARNATRISVTTTLLEQPLPFGEQYRWDANLGILAAAVNAEPPATPVREAAAEVPLPAGIPERQRGVSQLRGLIIAALRRHGTEGAFGARRLTGPQLLAALFGADLVAPPLMWEVIYTCDRLVDAGRLTCEQDAGNPERPGSGGPDTYVWWPDDNSRRHAEHRTPTQPAVLAGQIREHWVPPFCRLLPAGHQASDSARQAYAEWIVKVRGPDADITLPPGYTFVRGALRGSPDLTDLLRLAAAPQLREDGTAHACAQHLA